MTPPPEPSPRDPDVAGEPAYRSDQHEQQERSWWPFRRRRDDRDEPRLGPAEPTGFDWTIDDLDAALHGPDPVRQPTGRGLVGGADPGAGVGTGAGPGDPVPDRRARVVCNVCHTEVGQGDYCEECGSAMTGEWREPSVPGPHPGGIDPDATVPLPIPMPEPGRDENGLLVLGGLDAAAPAPEPAAADPHDPLDPVILCTECRGSYGPEGYCENCGAKAVNPRHHFVAVAAPWLAGVCDRGIRHAGNEDAMAIRGGDTARAALVVCDGVSTAPHSSEASLAAAQAAADVLGSSHARGMAGVPSALMGALGQGLEAAADAAAEAVSQVTREVTANGPIIGGGPSCTFVAAAVDEDVVVVGNVGDSRAYWFPDRSGAICLTTDDSWATEQMKAGASREEAEAGPHAHTITRWLGDDSPGHAPALTSLHVQEPGWLLLCSDGLWNYASEPHALGAVLRYELAGLTPQRGGQDAYGAPAVPEEAADAVPAIALAQAMVDWANAQGGHDNISVALARLHPAQERPFSTESRADLDVPVRSRPADPDATMVLPQAHLQAADVRSQTTFEKE